MSADRLRSLILASPIFGNFVSPLSTNHIPPILTDAFHFDCTDGRNDDIIVFNNGEKWNSIPSEGIISQHPLVSSAIIIGDGRFEPALLIEPKEDQTDLIELL